MIKLGFFVGHIDYLPHAKLLYQSIMDNTQLGEMSEIYVVTPEHLNLNIELSAINQLRVTVDKAYRSIPYIDKMFAAAEFEKVCGDEYLWLDVDSYFFKNVDYRKNIEIYANPVDDKNIGELFGEEHNDLWKILYQHFNLIDSFPFLATRVSKEKIYPYFNVSMVLINKNRQLFRTVKESIVVLLSDERIKRIMHQSQLHKMYIHQAIFSCAMLKLYHKNIKPLPYGINYTLRYHEKTPTPIPYGDVISIKYDDAFEKIALPSRWKETFDPIKKDIKPIWYY